MKSALSLVGAMVLIGLVDWVVLWVVRRAVTFARRLILKHS